MQADLVNRQNEIAEINRQSDYQRVQDSMTSLAQQLDTNTKLLQAAKANYKEVDEIRTEYGKYLRQKEEKQNVLEDMNRQIETLNAVYNDPDLSTLKFMGQAPTPA